MMAGIAQYFYHGSRLVLVLMAVYVLLGAIKSKAKGVTQGRKEAKTQRGLNLLATWRLNIFWVALAFGVMALPRFAPMLLNNLPMTGNEKAMRLPLDLGMNSLRAALAWVGKSDLSPFWLSSAPLLQWFAVLAFGIGLAVSLWRWRDGRYAVLILSVILTTIFGGAIWTAAPLYVRYMTAVPAIALLVAVGVSIQEKNFTTETQSTQRKIRKIDHTAIIQIIVVAAICGQGIWAAMAQLPEAKGQIRAELWEEDRLAKKAAALPSGMAAVLMASAGFGAKPPDPRVMEAIGIAHYVAAYGERRAVVLNWDGGKILDKQLKRLKMDYTVIKAYPEAIFQ
ncbi:MAG: hypothetical protein ABI690_34210, partial [Chloroflexota bacterium]